MNKSKVFVEKIGRYIREISIVVIGVAITLSAGIWINNANNKKDLKLYLNMIKIEMENNLKNFELNKVPLQTAFRYSNYLKSTEPNLLVKDSIVKIENQIYHVKKYFIKKDAFEMLKNSGLMRLIKDKNGLLFLWESYARLNEIEFLLNEFTQFKADEMVIEMHGGFNQIAPLYNFSTQSMAPVEMLLECNKAIEILKDALSKFEQFYVNL